MGRWVAWQDVAVFGGLPLLFTGLGVGAWLTPQEWPVPGVVILLAVIWGAWAIFGIFLWQRWRSKPDFELSNGAVVWTGGISEITAERVEAAIKFFIAKAAEKTGTVESAVSEMCSKLRIEFVDGRVSWGGLAYNGIASGFRVKVNWLGGFKKNAFFHELIHVLQEMVLNKPRDYDHEDSVLWSLVGEMKREFAE